jgi:hypothetical protein
VFWYLIPYFLSDWSLSSYERVCGIYLSLRVLLKLYHVLCSCWFWSICFPAGLLLAQIDCCFSCQRHVSRLPISVCISFATQYMTTRHILIFGIDTSIFSKGGDTYFRKKLYDLAKSIWLSNYPNIHEVNLDSKWLFSLYSQIHCARIDHRNNYG